MGWSSNCLGLPSICICVEAKALSGRSTTGLMGESQNPLAGLRGWKLYKDPFISFGGNPVTPPGGDRYDWTSQKKHPKTPSSTQEVWPVWLQIWGKSMPFAHRNMGRGERNLEDVYFLVVKYANETLFEAWACHQKNKKWEGRKETSGKEFVCVCVKFGFLQKKSNPPMRTSNSLPWIHELFQKESSTELDFWGKTNFKQPKIPHDATNGFCLPILENPIKIQRNPWIGTYYLTDSHGNPFFLGTTLVRWCFCSAA